MCLNWQLPTIQMHTAHLFCTMRRRPSLTRFEVFSMCCVFLSAFLLIYLNALDGIDRIVVSI